MTLKPKQERYAPGELTRGEWRILTLAETRETRLGLAALAGGQLEKGLELLGIEVLERM